MSLPQNAAKSAMMRMEVNVPANELCRKLSQAHAISSMTFGHAHEAFGDLPLETRDNLLWALNDTLVECEKHLAELISAL